MLKEKNVSNNNMFHSLDKYSDFQKYKCCAEYGLKKEPQKTVVFIPKQPEMEINRKMSKLAERKVHPSHSSLTRIEEELICSSHRNHNGMIQLPRINTSQVVTEELGFIDAEQERSGGDGPVGKVFATQAEGRKCASESTSKILY